MYREVLINFVVRDAESDAEALEQVANVLPFDPDSDPRHKIESWVPVEPKVVFEDVTA